MHTLTAETAADRDGVDLGDLDAGEQDLDSLSDLDLGSIGSCLLYTSLVQLGDLHNALVTELGVQSRSNFIDILFFQTSHRCV